MNKFYLFLNQIRPLINAKALERAARLPANTLGKHYRWADGKPAGQPMSMEHAPNIVRAMCQVFGTVEIDGWTLYSSFEEPGIFGQKPIPGREIESVEIETPGKGTHFEYQQPQYRSVWDDFDFETDFK